MKVGNFFRWVAFGSFVLAGVSALWAFQPRTAAFIVLDVLKAPPAGKTAIPPGWQVKVTSGQPDIIADDEIIDNVDQAFLHFRSVKSSFGLERAIDIDPAQTPYLSWRWKVAQLPKGGDFRHYATDDQAAQVMLAFADHRILTYLWDSTAPAGTMESASSVPLVHIFAIVCRSGATNLNQWLQENHNVAADYEKAFGKPAPRVKGLRLQINSQHTGTAAESYFGDVAFRDSRS